MNTIGFGQNHIDLQVSIGRDLEMLWEVFGTMAVYLYDQNLNFVISLLACSVHRERL